MQHHNNNFQQYDLQSYVTKNSWTTENCNVTSAAKRQEMSAFQSRDLIREYLLKTRVPEILKPSQNRSRSPLPNFSTYTVPSEMNLAYKHPMVIAEELKKDGGEGMALTETQAVRKHLNIPDNSSLIIPHRMDKQKKKTNDDRPHLIGNFSASIAKTWEQLTGMIEHTVNDESSSISDTDTDEKQSYVLFVRNRFNFQPENENFSVNKAIHDESSEKFYDSIDNTNDYEDDVLTSVTEVEAGEGMAEELDSLEMRCNDVDIWSIES